MKKDEKNFFVFTFYYTFARDKSKTTIIKQLF